MQFKFKYTIWFEKFTCLLNVSFKKVKCVMEFGNIFTCWLKKPPKVKCVMDDGNIFTGWLKSPPKVKYVMNDGNIFTFWLKLLLKVKYRADG